jgi:hypothetical protein
MTKPLKLTAMALALAAAGFTTAAQAGAIITNGTVTLGVQDFGQLNQGGGTPSAGDGTTLVGLRFNATNSDSTSPGCACEGWGAAIVSKNITGFRSTDSGNSGNTSLVSLTATASTAVSTVNINGPTGAPVLQVKHDYHPLATTPNLYEVTVSITNLSGAAIAAGDLRYRRVMDWDIPTPGNEVVSIQGVPAALGIANGNNVFRTDNNGFNSGNPLSFSSFGLQNQNFTDVGPDDIGALFDFEFAAVANGDTLTFFTYYGAAPTKAAADVARSLVDGDPTDVDVGLYSYGVCASGLTGCNVPTGAPNTFIFGFGASGGVLAPPDQPGTPPPTGVPEPGSLALLGLGFASLAALRRRQRV